MKKLMKLSLKKEKIQELEKDSMNSLKGGYHTAGPYCVSLWYTSCGSGCSSGTKQS